MLIDGTSFLVFFSLSPLVFSFSWFPSLHPSLSLLSSPIELPSSTHYTNRTEPHNPRPNTVFHPISLPSSLPIVDCTPGRLFVVAKKIIRKFQKEAVLFLGCRMVRFSVTCPISHLTAHYRSCLLSPNFTVSHITTELVFHPESIDLLIDCVTCCCLLEYSSARLGSVAIKAIRGSS